MFIKPKKKFYTSGIAPYYKAAAAGGGPVLPSALPGLIGWYKANTGVFNDAGTTPATNGQNVVQWNDQSGAGNHLVKNGSDNTPKLNTTGFVGVPALDFIGANGTILVKGAMAIGTGNKISVFVVGQMLGATANFGRLVSYSKTGAAQDFDNAGSSAILIRDASNNAITSYTNSTQGSSQAISLATNYRLGMIFDGINATPYVNGVAGTPSANANSWASPGILSIGRDALGSVTQGFTGPIAEIVICTADTTSQVAGLDLYFKNGFGL